ncbi:hypothetical protein LCGC14_1701730 [marine sediment metagenome]|uniref:Uncharacterized protein n=1 Tax=marine sediment metagenome TaxID=412755 RepID=A0A0F9HI79_9ZZZZ
MDDCQAKREKQILLELDRLDGDIGGLKEAIDGLGKGLSLVLREPGPTEETATKDENPKCNLANTIAAYRRRIAELTMSVRELTDRIEV